MVVVVLAAVSKRIEIYLKRFIERCWAILLWNCNHNHMHALIVDDEMRTIPYLNILIKIYKEKSVRETFFVIIAFKFKINEQKKVKRQ